MPSCYIPYVGDGPLVVSINGHDLLLVGGDPEVFEESAFFDEAADEVASAAASASFSEPASSLEVREYDLDQFETEDLIEEEEEETDFFLDGVESFESDDDSSLPLTVQGGDDGVPLSEEEMEYLEADLNDVNQVLMRKLERFAAYLAKSSGSGVVFIPPTTSLDETLARLYDELPWCQ
jgi:hypothetical protein